MLTDYGNGQGFQHTTTGKKNRYLTWSFLMVCWIRGLKKLTRLSISKSNFTGGGNRGKFWSMLTQSASPPKRKDSLHKKRSGLIGAGTLSPVSEFETLPEMTEIRYLILTLNFPKLEGKSFFCIWAVSILRKGWIFY